MGSTGTGRFSDYSNARSNDGGQTGGSSGVDKCERAFSANLEEIDRCDYYRDKGVVPDVGESVLLVVNKRLVVQTEDGVEIGYLPTSLNYLIMCMESGFEYSGVVSASTTNPIRSISVDFEPL